MPDKNYDDRTVCPLLTLQLFNYITSYDKLNLKVSFPFFYYSIKYCKQLTM